MRRLRTLALGASLLSAIAVAGAAGGGSITLAQDAPVTVRIGSDDFYELRLLAEIYAQALEANGFVVERSLGLGTRPDRAPAFNDGLIDLVPEYVGSGHGIFDPSVVTPDGEANARALETAYAAAGVPVTILGLTAGQDNNAGAVRQATADEFSLTKMSDLAAVQDQLRWGLTSECDAQAFCKGALEAYGITYPPAQRESLGACGTPMADALAQEAIDFAWVCTTQPEVRTYGFVVLEDDLVTQGADNIAPLVRNDFLEKVDGGADALAAILDPISAQVTTDILFDLGYRVGIEHEDVADVAAEFLAALPATG